MLGKIEGRRRRGQQKMRWLDDITDSVDMNLTKLWKMVKVRAAVHGIEKSQTLLSNWIAANLLIGLFCCAHDLSSCLKSALFLVLFPNLNRLTLARFFCSHVSSLPNSYASSLIYSTEIYCPLRHLPSIFLSIRSFPVSWLFTSGDQSIRASDDWGAYQRNDFSEPRLLPSMEKC